MALTKKASAQIREDFANTRDVRLSEAQIVVLIDAARRRLRALEKSISADSGTYHKALQRKFEDRDDLRQALCDLEVARDQIYRKQVAAVAAALGVAE